MNGNWRVGCPALLPAAVVHLMLNDMANLVTKLKPQRRWAQVSLRTVLVSLLCVALSMW